MRFNHMELTFARGTLTDAFREVHAFYVKYLLPISFDVQSMEKSRAMTRMTEPSKARPVPQEQLVAAPVPIACRLDETSLTLRMEEFAQLFRDALVGRDTMADGIRFRFAAGSGVEEQIRDLARREQSCCPFFDFTIAVHGDEVWWNATVTDPEARPILDDFFSLPERLEDKRAGA